MRNIIRTSFLWLSLISLQGVSQPFWSLTNEFWGGPKTGIVLRDDQVLFVCSANRILKSINGGEHFEQVLVGSSVQSLFFSSDGILYAGGTGLIYTSRNNGVAWDSVSVDSDYPVRQFLETPDGNLFAITGNIDEGDGVFYSGDRGKSWNPRNNGLGLIKGCEELVTDKNGRLYLAVADENTTGSGGLFISENEGLLWEKVTITHDSISSPVRTGRISGLSISPEDTVYLSCTGIATNYLLELNLRKSIDDIKSDKGWQYMHVDKSLVWWNDKALNSIHFARNGDWYSSYTQSINRGGTYFSTDKGKTWERRDQGLGASVLGIRTRQYFVENPKGRIFMIQYLDERIYVTDQSVLTTIGEPLAVKGRLHVFPNPVNARKKFSVTIPENSGAAGISLYSMMGNLLYSCPVLSPVQEIIAPDTPGNYILRVNSKQSSYTSIINVLKP